MYAHFGIMGQAGRCIGGIGHLPPLSAGNALPGVRSARCKSDVNWVVCDHGVARCGGCNSCRFSSWPTQKASRTPMMVKPGRLEAQRSEEHTSALQSLMPIPYAVFRLKKKTPITSTHSAWSTNN